jgi:23S rRNA pseudouridine2457 synthase
MPLACHGPIFLALTLGPDPGYRRGLNSLLGKLRLGPTQAENLGVKPGIQQSPLLELCCQRMSAKTSYRQAARDIDLAIDGKRIRQPIAGADGKTRFVGLVSVFAHQQGITVDLASLSETENSPCWEFFPTLPTPSPGTLPISDFPQALRRAESVHDRGGDRATLKDYVPVPGVYPVGRLDRDSEGLLLLTNDGPLQHRLSNPKYGHPRTYWVQVERIPNEAALNQLRQGVVIQTQRTRPAEVQLLPGEPPLPPRHPPIRDRKTVSTCWLALTLREGRNRQVRRMTAAVGHPTLRLVRVAIGPLQLGDLPLGKWRSLTPEEVQSLHQLCRSGRSPR